MWIQNQEDEKQLDLPRREMRNDFIVAAELQAPQGIYLEQGHTITLIL